MNLPQFNGHVCSETMVSQRSVAVTRNKRGWSNFDRTVSLVWREKGGRFISNYSNIREYEYDGANPGSSAQAVGERRA